MCVSATGVLAPVTGTSFLVIVLQDTDTREEDRVLWCKILLVSRHIIIDFYSFTLFCNFVFRVVLILYSDRGLVVRGCPELTLFRRLYWTVFWAFFCLGLFNHVYSSSKISVDPFTGSTVGNICLQRPLKASANSIKGRLLTMAFASIGEGYNQYLSWKVRSYLRGVSPRARYFSLGRYRRNLLSFQQTSKYLSTMTLIAYFKCGLNIFQLIMTSHGPSPEAMFWLNNGFAFLIFPILHGVILPIIMEVPPAHKEVVRRTQFYVRSPGLPSPRKDFEVSEPTPLSSRSVPPTGPGLVSEGPAGLVTWRRGTGSTGNCRNCHIRPKENMTNIASSSIRASSLSSSSMHAPSMASSNMHASVLPPSGMHTFNMPSSRSESSSMPLTSLPTSSSHPFSLPAVSD